MMKDWQDGLMQSMSEGLKVLDEPNFVGARAHFEHALTLNPADGLITE